MEKGKQKPLTLYQQIAVKHGVTPEYVGRLARKDRIPKRSKIAKQIINDLILIKNLLNN